MDEASSRHSSSEFCDSIAVKLGKVFFELGEVFAREFILKKIAQRLSDGCPRYVESNQLIHSVGPESWAVLAERKWMVYGRPYNALTPGAVTARGVVPCDPGSDTVWKELDIVDERWPPPEQDRRLVSPQHGHCTAGGWTKFARTTCGFVATFRRLDTFLMILFVRT